METPKKRGRTKESKTKPKIVAEGEHDSSTPTSQPSTRRGRQSSKGSGEYETPITRQTTFRYSGPPEYLLDPNRNDAYADPNNIVQDPDGSNRPRDWGDYHEHKQDRRVHGVISKDEEALKTARSLDLIAKVSPTFECSETSGTFALSSKAVANMMQEDTRTPVSYTFANPKTSEETLNNFRTFPYRDSNVDYLFPPESEKPSVESLLHPFETSNIRDTPLSTKPRKLKQPSKEPADLEAFDREIQADVRIYYAKVKNRPELMNESILDLDQGRSQSTPYDDYPIPIHDDMRIDPMKNEYFRSISAWYTRETPQHYWEMRKGILREQEAARLKERMKKLREEEGHAVKKDPVEVGH
ncbi:hypothetical protein BDZ45DRAFT_258378 [Acephala macrosclerotiorum]|nr:hypothetical protein BDZ45DRAFT_258378 [Acephala macrosclerotiorum]